MNKGKISVNQKKFADEYIKTGNATEAYKSAYKTSKMKDTTINSEASKTLRKPLVKQYIEEQMQKLEDAQIMDAKEALKQITKIAKGEPVTQEYMDMGTGILTLEDVPPKTTDVLNAAKEILKRYPLSELEKVQIKKAQAEAVKAEAEAEVAKAQIEQLNTVTDKAREKIDKLSTEDLRNLAKLAGEESD